MSSQLPDTIKLFCWVLGDESSFSVKIGLDQTVDDLKKAIIAKIPNLLQGIDAHRLVLFKAIVLIKEKYKIQLSDLKDGLEEGDTLREHFETNPPPKSIHIVIVPPAPPPVVPLRLPLRRPPEDDDSDNLRKRVCHLEQRLETQEREHEYERLRARNTIMSPLDIRKFVLDRTGDADVDFFKKLFDSSWNKVPEISLPPDVLVNCRNEADVQKNFNTFFSLIPQPERERSPGVVKDRDYPWVIHDSSSKSYFKDPNAKVDFSILDGPQVLWPQFVTPIELKFSIASDHTEAIGQLSDRFSRIFEKQPWRPFAVGAIASGTEIEIVWVDRSFHYKRSGPIRLDLTDKRSPGVRMLLDLVTAPGDCLGYIPFDREKDLVQTINTIRYKALIQCTKTGRDANSRYTFVALGIMEEEDVVIKGSINDYECVLLKRLASLQVQHIPNVCLDGQFENGLRYMVMKPYGKHLELSNDGIGVILGCLYDVARTMELAASYHIFHRDIKPSNIVIHNGCGYLIDWGVATEGSEVNNLSATLAYCSIKSISVLMSEAFFVMAYWCGIKVEIQEMCKRIE
ncbi:hypothetical protein L211DRAFT_845789 [Terfezia boudieri ATCC MYA-4762]|uniref:Uncharacterized protein n=1 Tax=Terfezia boudieri ATCC MYA-4762 TaxID=1051890 RepID=A0A3N4LY88_9PEZI|nr:hypothetical protein L211DRAFT_845789 [Terfezia boudieri ATCC MYA-4762]